MHVRGVAGQQHTSGAVGRRLPGHVGEPGDPGRAVYPEVGSPHGDERAAEITQGRLTGLPGVPLAHHHPHPLPVLQPADGLSAVAVTADAELRLLGHLDLGDQGADGRVPAGELDPGGLADQAATSVAPGEVFRPQRPAVGQLDVDAGAVLRETRHVTSAVDRHLQLVHPAGQDLLEAVLQQREPVGMAGGKVADVQPDPGEPRDLSRRPLREEPVGDAALIEDLDGARVQTAGARAVELLAGAPLDHGDVDPGQRQLARQHHPRRAASGDHDRMPGHHNPLSCVGSCPGQPLCGTTRVLPQAPGCAID